jgi:predicted outer membrane protein
MKKFTIVLTACSLIFAAGCASKYALNPEDRRLMEDAITASEDAQDSANTARRAANKAVRAFEMDQKK